MMEEAKTGPKHCLDCGRFIRDNQAEPIPICTPCIDKRLEKFSPELEPIAARGTR